MKKIITLVLALMIVLTFAACGSKTEPAPSGSDSTTDPGTSEQATSSSEEQEQPSNDANSLFHILCNLLKVKMG